jgi:hypothetical protein
MYFAHLGWYCWRLSARAKMIKTYLIKSVLFTFVPMSLPLTNHTLEKLETLLFAMGYKVRYEKGNFKTGSCLLEHNKVVVVNKFSNLEGKIAALVTLVKQTNADENLLEEKQRQFYQSLQQTELF